MIGVEVLWGISDNVERIVTENAYSPKFRSGLEDG
jgi:hypothetical protein